MGSSRIFFGWWIVFITGIISGLGHGFYYYGISVFFKDIASELGLSRAVTSIATGVGRLEGGITSPLTGWLADRYGPKWVIFTGILIVSVGLILMHRITSVWSYMVVWGLIIGIGLNIGLTVPVDKALNDWFINRRGTALGIKFALISVVGVALLPIVSHLVITQGWRTTCFIWGCIMIASAPFALIFVKQKRPEYYGLLPDGALSGLDSDASIDDMIDRGIQYAAGYEETEFRFKDALRTRVYWIVGVAFGVQTAVSGGLNIHIIPFLTDMGIDRTVAGGMMGMMVFFTIPSRFLGGAIADRAGKGGLPFLIAGGFLLQVIGIVSFLITPSVISMYIFLILFGFGSGAGTVLFIAMLARFFGRKAFGSIFGSSIAVRAPASLLAPVFSGWVYDTTGSYTAAFILFAGAAAVAALLMCFTRPKKR